MSREELDKFLSSKSLLYEPDGTYDRYNYHSTPLEAYRWKAYQIGSSYYPDIDFDKFYLVCIPLAVTRFADYSEKDKPSMGIFERRGMASCYYVRDGTESDEWRLLEMSGSIPPSMRSIRVSSAGSRTTRSLSIRASSMAGA